MFNNIINRNGKQYLKVTSNNWNKYLNIVSTNRKSDKNILCCGLLDKNKRDSINPPGPSQTCAVTIGVTFFVSTVCLLKKSSTVRISVILKNDRLRGRRLQTDAGIR